MSQPAKVPEPSIDEILASIRRSIVPDDETGKPAARKPGSRKVAPAPLGAPVAAGAKGRRADGEAVRAGSDAAGGERSEQVSGKGADRRSDDGRAPLEGQTAEGGRDEADAASAPADAAATGAPVTAPGEATEAGLPAPDAPLLSPRATAAVDTAFNSLANTVLLQNPRTLEDLVRDMLRPMLKSWLDANLPDMVERLVRAEIERLSRRG
jgi:cell pole-organizing protein PopZ